MGKIQGPLKSSCNAGELSNDLDTKIGLKQFYNGGKRFKNLEPVPQSGFRLGPGTRHIATLASADVRIWCLKVTGSLSYMLAFSDGKIEIWRCTDLEKVKTLTTTLIVGSRINEYQFYAEGNTVGIFHKSDHDAIRLFRNEADDTDWTISTWPYESKPKVDLGATYTKTPDKWEIYLRYTGDTHRLVVSLVVDGETSDSVKFATAAATDDAPYNGTDADFTTFATNMQNAINGLPNIGSGVTVAYLPLETAGEYRVFRVTFGGALSGVQYDFDCQVTNTSTASTLVAHVDRGETEYEDLISATRGGFGGMAMIQDRATYFGARARLSALCMSKVGEYFNLNTELVGDSNAILSAPRTETSQEVLAVLEDTYPLVFTDQGEWFVNNRAFKQSEPLNFILASEIGSRRGVVPQKFDGRVWFTDRNGSSLWTNKYDAVNESYLPAQEDLLANTLISRIKRLVTQRKVEGTTMPRLWVLRSDGRLAYGVVVQAQEITAFVEWISAESGSVKDIHCDGRDQMWIVVDRNGQTTLERMEEASDNLYQCARYVTTDLTGQITGLAIHNGRSVWARCNGYVLGPYTVNSGSINIGISAASAIVGLWQAPVFESMPYWHVLPNEEVLLRPGQVKAINIALIATESVAVGANGQPARNIDLSQPTDDMSVARPPFTGSIEVAGLSGAVLGPTIVITQTRPGRLRVRDFTPKVKN